MACQFGNLRVGRRIPEDDCGIIATRGEKAAIGAESDTADGVGMTAPFIVAALFARPFLGWMSRHRAKLAYVEKAMGVMLIVFAILIATGWLSYLADFLIRVMPSSGTLG